MPEIRPFRALRYDIAAIGDLALVVSPPYDVVDAAGRARLAARHRANVIQLELPSDELGDEPDDRYRRAARTLAAWRSDGTLRKDPHPSIYVYEQTYLVPGTDDVRVQRGFLARLRLEPFGPGSGVLPHERTLAGPREDRYRLLRATGVNISPVVGLYDDGSGTGRAVLEDASAGPAEIDLTDDEGTRHRLWSIPADGQGAAVVAPLLETAGRGPITIADGHHRYETALRYRDERRMSRSCEEDPPFDYVLAFLLDVASERLTVLPTHRVVRGLGDDGAAATSARLDRWFDVQAGLTAAELQTRFGAADQSTGGHGRFGLWTRAGGASLTARRSDLDAYLPAGGAALLGLDVSLLGATLDHALGLDADTISAGAVGYTKSASEAISWVDSGTDGADLAFLLEPTPVASVLAVARDGDVMPQKSTYFYPKAITGLVLNPHEW